MKFEKSEFLDGIRDSVPVIIAVVTFGMLFGATAINNGLTLGQLLLSSAVVFAGASQFVFLELYGQQAPVWSILLAVFAVNFRHVLYSMSIGRYMGAFNAAQKYTGFFFLMDLLFGAGETRAEKHTLTPTYYFTYGIFLYCVWMGATFVGGFFGNLIADPAAFGLDMLISLYFLVLLVGFRSRANWLSTVIASGLAAILIYKYIGGPWHIMGGAMIGVLCAAILGTPKEEADA